MSDQHRAAFLDEARELLSDLEQSLLLLEGDPSDPELIGRVFRALHTIKGSGSMFGFDSIAAFTHDVESVFDMVRKGELQVTGPLIALALGARDRIAVLLELDEGEDDPDRPESDRITEALRALASMPAPASAGEDAGAAPAAVQASSPKPQAAESIYRIRFRPPRDSFKCGGDPAGLIDELRELGRCGVVLHTDEIPPLEALDPEACYLYWDVVLATTHPLTAIQDVFIFVDDPEGARIELVEDANSTPADDKKIGEILVARGEVDPEAINRALARQRRLGDYLVEDEGVAPGQVTAALVEQQVVREQRAKRQALDAAASIRVPSERLDVLLNLVGEMVTVQARLGQISAQRGENDLQAVAEEVERLTWALRDNVMNIRMLPIGSTFSKFKRLVHDLSRELGKEIQLTTDGAETELDKTVIDRLADPMVHLIRNAVDHGIETPDERVAAGKTRTGTIHLSASHAGAHVRIKIRDDGAGLDREAISRQALERGLMAPGAEPSDKDLFGLIMAPGFSTATRVTSVSGRGVGMDVVKQALDALSGTIEIESRQGEGTTFVIKLPLTLAIIDGLLVTIGTDSFVLPLAAVHECIELTGQDVKRACGRDIVSVRGQIVPYVRLRDLFGTGGSRPEIEQIVITETEGERIGFAVDRIVGEHQTVIKSLGRVYRSVAGVSGSTILGDGSVALILDLPKLIKRAAVRERVATAACA